MYKVDPRLRYMVRLGRYRWILYRLGLYKRQWYKATQRCWELAEENRALRQRLESVMRDAARYKRTRDQFADELRLRREQRMEMDIDMHVVSDILRKYFAHD